MRDHYLHFTRKEKNGILVIIGCVLLLTAIPVVYPLIVKEKPLNENYAAQLSELRLQKDSAERSYKKYPNDDDDERPYGTYSKNERAWEAGELFYFDPNTNTEKEWKRLGLKDKTIRTILHYISKGGKFRAPDDLKKIWGLHPQHAERLMPYVKIAYTAPLYVPHFSTGEKKLYEKKAPSSININTADSLGYLSLPGIGPAFSKRIIKFRDRLGGFYTIEQVAETFGLPDSVFQKIKPLLVISGGVKKMDLNQVSMEQLKEHPYIRYQLANAIFQYRVQHGNFKKIDDIKKIMIVTDELFNKLAPYLTAE
jgi:competence protein ComEA